MQSLRPCKLIKIRKITNKLDLFRNYSNKNDDSSNNDGKSFVDKQEHKNEITALTISSSNKIFFNCYKCGALCTNLNSTILKYSKCVKCNNSLAIFSNETKTQFVPKIETETSKQAFKFKKLPPPKTICQFLDKYIIGQNNSKKVISVAVYNHYKKINNNLSKSIKLDSVKPRNSDYSVMKLDDSKISLKGNYINEQYLFMLKFNYFSDFYRIKKLKEQQEQRSSILYSDKHEIKLEKSNILMIGPTGTGKTLLASTVAKCLDVPFVICDCTTLTQAGYVGEDVESIIAKLFQNSDYNTEKCQQGIVFLDEIDKISSVPGKF